MLEHNAPMGEKDEYGQDYVLNFESVKGERRAMVRSGESFPRLTTCYVLSEFDMHGRTRIILCRSAYQEPA